jgi:hypothetical protein
MERFKRVFQGHSMCFKRVFISICHSEKDHD